MAYLRQVLLQQRSLRHPALHLPLPTRKHHPSTVAGQWAPLRSPHKNFGGLRHRITATLTAQMAPVSTSERWASTTLLIWTGAISPAGRSTTATRTATFYENVSALRILAPLATTRKPDGEILPSADVIAGSVALTHSPQPVVILLRQQNSTLELVPRMSEVRARSTLCAR
jgi:hypothetical protein